ncbi:hypothetical protein TPENAI_61242 [Tenacibaculum litopenaei]|uniref:hypothetical protein n=1 Tax=Tenacibaculum litopenaei TaxID=396016 RepID=UPI0038949051
MKNFKQANFLMKAKHWGIVVFAGLTTVLSCSDIEELNHKHEQKKSIAPKINSLTLQEASKNDDFHDVTGAFKIGVYGRDRGSQEKPLENEFTIQTDQINRIEEPNYVSYTFQISREGISDDAFENLVIEKKNGKIQGFILKYENPRYVLEGNRVVLQAQLSRTPNLENIQALLQQINNPSLFRMESFECTIQTIYSLRYCRKHGVFNKDNALCGHEGLSNYVRTYERVCSGGGTSNSNNNLGGPTKGGGSSGGGGSGSSSNNSSSSPVNTNPVKGFERFNSISDATSRAPSRFASVESHFQYLRNVGFLMGVNQNNRELSKLLVDVSNKVTTLKPGESHRLVYKTVELLNILKRNKGNFKTLSGADKERAEKLVKYIKVLSDFKALVLDLSVYSDDFISSSSDWFFDSSKESVRQKIRTFIQYKDKTTKLKKWIKGQLELEIETHTFKWKAASGMLQNNPNFKFTHVDHKPGISYYKLTSGAIVGASPYEKSLSSSGDLKNAFDDNIGFTTNRRFYYIKFSSNDTWSELLFHPKMLGQELKLLFKLGAIELGKSIGQYVLPIEDVNILINGTDFNGDQVSRWQAAGFLLLEVAQVGKVAKAFKVVSSVAKSTKTWKVAAQIGGKTYVKTVTALSTTLLRKADDVSTGAKQLVDQLHKSGKYSKDVIEDGIEVAIDVVEKTKKRIPLDKLIALFKRGNDFNKKAEVLEWYKYNEIHLANGKRLDSYDPVAKEIISRKATDLQNIKFTTFEKYLKEFTKKYKVGTKIRSNKYLKELDGKLLEGTYVLEIPDSNQNLSNIQTFIDYAWKNHNVKIRFKPE